MPERLLVLGPSWLGDAIMAIPVLRALRSSSAGSRIAVLARGGVADLYRAVPAVDEVIVYARRPGISRLGAYADLVRRLREFHPDTALVMPRSFGSAWTALLSGAPRRIGFRASGRDFLFTDPIDRDARLLKIHRVDSFRHLLAPFSIERAEEARDPPELSLPDDAFVEADRLLEPLDGADGPLVAFIPGAHYGSAKQWPEERFIELARRLGAERRASIVLIGGPGADQLVCDRIRHSVEDVRVVDLAGKTSIMGLCAVLKRSQLVVSNDTGAMHAAAAVGAPLVAIFGSTDPVTTSPYGAGPILVREPVDCAPCLLRECPIDHRCMTRVDVDRVFAACARQLETAAPVA